MPAGREFPGFPTAGAGVRTGGDLYIRPWPAYLTGFRREGVKMPL